MTQPLPAHRQCSGDIVGGLIETASAALLDSFPVLSGDPYDVELVIDALRVLRPKLGEMETLGGLLHMVRGNWDDAIHVFSQVVATAPGYAYGKALLAFALASKGDPDWRQAAAEALSENPDPETRKLVQTLQARDDLREAVRRHENGAEFVVPESVAVLRASTRPRIRRARLRQVRIRPRPSPRPTICASERVSDSAASTSQTAEKP